MIEELALNNVRPGESDGCSTFIPENVGHWVSPQLLWGQLSPGVAVLKEMTPKRVASCLYKSSTALTQLPPLKQTTLLPPTVPVFGPRASPFFQVEQSADTAQWEAQKYLVLSHWGSLSTQSPSFPPWQLKGRCLWSRMREGLGLLPPCNQRRGSAHSVCPLPTTCKHTFGLPDGETASRREREGAVQGAWRGKGKVGGEEDRKLLCWEKVGKKDEKMV